MPRRPITDARGFTMVELLAIGEATSGFAVSGTATTYKITEHSESGTDFTLERDGAGIVTRSCSVHGHGLCKADPDANGNRS